jgi:16S rRNA (guanine(1405)-N(7))-methyltransferase
MKKEQKNKLTDLIEETKTSRKYREMDLPNEFLLDLASQAAKVASTPAEIKTIFRKNLHNVIAPYLENIDYRQETLRLINEPEILNDLPAYCLSVMKKHASTRERIPWLVEFFGVIEEQIGRPKLVLDLACALDPLSLPWLKLAPEPTFLAFDVNGARINYLNQLFAAAFPFAKAIQQDIFVDPPCEKADCAFFFKEAHRLEKRQPGATIQLLQQLNVDVIVLTLPATDLARHHSLENYHTQLVEKAIQGQDFHFEKIRVGDELLFFIRKGSS